MGNAQSQNPSSNPIQLPRKISGKFPAVPSIRDRTKDSDHRSGSASSSGTALKGGRANDQTGATAARPGGEQGSASRPEAAPGAAERHGDAPAPPTETSTQAPSKMPSAPVTVPCQYRTGKTLGSGTYAIVKEAVHIKTGKYYACKVINKKLMEGREFMVRNEIAVLKRVSSGHQNIVTLYDYFETTNNLYLCFDLCTGGELFDRICAKGNYHEPDAAGLVRTIMKTVQYIHHSGIVHRHLEPENLLFRTPAEDADIMIADFGLSRVMEEERFNLLTDICGTPGYMAPEIFKKTGHGKPVDIWAMGVITYFLLAGYTPFDRENQQQEMEAILAGDYKFEPEYWANVSETAKDFVSACLTVNPTKRPTAADMLKHAWLASDKPHFVPDPENPSGGPTDLLPHIQKCLDAKTRFRRAVWGIIAIKRMSTLAAISGGNELQANIAKYKEESEKEDVDEGREVLHHHNQDEAGEISTSRMSAQPSPYRVQHVEGEPRRHRLEPRRSMVQSAPPPQKLQTPQDREWIKSDSSSLQLQSGGDGWQPKDLQGVPHCSRSETPTPPSSTETILDVAAGVSEGFDIHQNRQQSNYLRIRRDGASVPSHDCYHPDTDDNASMTYDKVNDNYSEQFSDVASETDNGPCSLKTISKRSFSTFSSRSTWSTSSTDSGDTCKVYD